MSKKTRARCRVWERDGEISCSSSVLEPLQALFIFRIARTPVLFRLTRPSIVQNSTNDGEWLSMSYTRQIRTTYTIFIPGNHFSIENYIFFDLGRTRSCISGRAPKTKRFAYDAMYAKSIHSRVFPTFTKDRNFRIPVRNLDMNLCTLPIILSFCPNTYRFSEVEQGIRTPSAFYGFGQLSDENCIPCQYCTNFNDGATQYSLES